MSAERSLLFDMGPRVESTSGSAVVRIATEIKIELIHLLGQSKAQEKEAVDVDEMKERRVESDDGGEK